VVQEGVFLEFCPHCCSSATMVQQGFILRLPQKDIDTCLEFFCECTSAKFKPDQRYICEMITHSILCTHSPPVRSAPNAPPVPTGINLTLYNVSDVLSGSTANTASTRQATPPRARTSQQCVNHDSTNESSITINVSNPQDEVSSQTQLQGCHVRN